MSETVTRVPAVEGWFTTDADEPHLIGSKCPACSTIVFPPRDGACPNPECDSTTLDATELSRRGRIWSYTENHYAPPPPYVAAEPFEPYALAAVELDRGGHGRARPGRHGRDRRRPAASAWTMQLEVDTLYRDDEHEYLVYVWAPGDSRERRVSARAATSPSSGSGMHPWGKWGRNFIEYGMVAARAALADAGLAWTRRPVRRRRRHHPQRLPRLHRRRDLRPGARLDGRARVVELRGVRVGRAGARTGAGPDPRRASATSPW